MRIRFRGVEVGGRYGPLIIKDAKQGAAEVRANDVARPSRDGSFMGREFRGGWVWPFDIYTNGRNLDEALEMNASLAKVWADPALRDKPGATYPLSYEIAGRWRRVYGRPDRFAGINPDILAMQGRGEITADFRVADPLFYDEAEQSVVLTIVPASVGGLKAPLKAPLSTVRSGDVRAGLVECAGDARTPLRVRFRGPVSNPWVRSTAGWEVGFNGSLAFDQTLDFDPLAGTVRLNGSPAGGRMTARTRLRGAMLNPGRNSLTFGGTDLSGRATATLSWRDAFTSI